MQIEREKFLQDLNLLVPGLSSKGNIPQSDKIIFSDGKMFTFNLDIMSMLPTDLEITGAVFANELLGVLGKMKASTLDIEKEDGQLLIKAGRAKAGITVENDIFLFVDDVLQDCEKTEFIKIPDDFITALNRASFCAGGPNSGREILNYIQFKDGKISATNNYRAIQIDMDADLPEFLIPADSVSCLRQYNFSKVGIGKSFIFFKNKNGLVVAVRLFANSGDEYPDVAHLMKKPENGKEIILPAGLTEVIDKAVVFMKSLPKGQEYYVKVSLKPGRIVVKGKGPYGWYEESVPVKEYQGDDLVFYVNPDFLKEIVPLVQEAVATDAFLQFRGEDFVHVFALVHVNENEGD